MSFFTELWESVFTPGTSPALITATHASFIALIISLSCLVYVTGSIHFINLLVLSVLLYGTVIWFINELKQIKLKENEQLEKEEAEGETKKDETSKEEVRPSSKTTATAKVATPKKRKV
ncbi:V-type ATPase assembly factor Pkr1p [[Candida] jaroonii]|uniref:V-type ATPase assembly factor Pkr1p n=1 Tax=[Candida] jaroonii TaxID=467808 RepID=A0ACA9YA12_9ASCO|nr:V-type ATPase assembly factor Pkr1p [[Candida] jaroonii]